MFLSTSVPNVMLEKCMYVANCDVCFRKMESRRADPLYFLVLTVIVVVGTAKAIHTPEQVGDHETTTKDGCRVRPAGHGVGVEVDCSGLRLGYIPNDLPADLRSLIMRGNNIIRLSDSVLQNHSQLTSLDLSRNNLQGLGWRACIQRTLTLGETRSDIQQTVYG